MSAPTIVCRRFQSSVQNTRQGYVDLAFPDVGIIVKNAILHETPNSRWIAWPATPNDGGQWTACLSFTATVDRPVFQAACIAAIDRYLAGEDGRDDLPLLMP